MRDKTYMYVKREYGVERVIYGVNLSEVVFEILFI
jgi:hypothetical protein